MLTCPACHAENPDGAKICVKCGTEMAPTPSEKAKAAAAKSSPARFNLRDAGRDLVDLLWLLVIFLLIVVGFLGETTHWTFRFVEREEAQLIQPQATPEPVVRAVPGAPRKPGRKASTKGNASQPGTVAFQRGPVGEKPAVQFGSPDTFYLRGKKQFDDHHYRDAFASLKQSLMIDPTFAKAYFGLGYLYSRFDMNDAAVRMYEMALRFNPDNVDSINNLAMMYYHAGNSDDAMVLLQKAVTLDAQNPDCQYNLGSIYLDKGRPTDALPVFQKASELRPNDPSILNNMALTYEKLGQKQGALDTWQKVMQNASNDPELLQQAKDHMAFLQTQG